MLFPNGLGQHPFSVPTVKLAVENPLSAAKVGATDGAFEYLAGKGTLVVAYGLAIGPNVAPKVLADRLAKVHNQEAIQCTPEQKGAIQACLGSTTGC